MENQMVDQKAASMVALMAAMTELKKAV